MSFTIGNEHITNQFTNNFFANAMDITSFLNDDIIFSEGKELNNTIWKNQWMKYCRIIMPHSGYTIEYSHPYKSDKHKDITQYEIYAKDGRLVDSDVTYCKENAEAQAYIKISQLSTFKSYYTTNVNKIEWLIDKIETFRIDKDPHSRYYRLSRDLKRIYNNKGLLREWKLKGLLEKAEKLELID